MCAKCWRNTGTVSDYNSARYVDQMLKAERWVMHRKECVIKQRFLSLPIKVSSGQAVSAESAIVSTVFPYLHLRPSPAISA